MELLLSSLSLSEKLDSTLAQLVGKQPAEITVALIENASDVSADASWVETNRTELTARGYQVEAVDLRNYRGKSPGLWDVLASKDVIWIGGGNTFYLRWILQDSGADEIIKELVSSGTVYGGDSAGAIVAGPTLKYFEDADDPKDSPEVILDGLHLTETVVVPHTDNVDYRAAMKKIDQLLQKDGYKTVLLKDSQAVVFDDDTQRIIS